MNRLTKKVASVGLSLATVVWLSGAAAIVPVAYGQTAADIQAQIQSLLASIALLQTQLAALGGSGAAGSSYSFTRDLTVGSVGDDVKALQQYLNGAGYKIAASGVGSTGNETTYFGNLTKAAVAKWQTAMSVAPAAGYFGPKSRTKLASLGGAGVPGVVLPGTAYLTVANDGPAAVTIPDETLYNNLLRLKFSAGNTEQRITGVTITRGGFIANTMISGVSVWDEAGNRYGNIIESLTADGKATVSFPTSPFVVPAGATKTMILAANIGNANSGTVNFSVASVSDITVASGSLTPTGVFPFTGNLMTIVDGINSLGNLWIDDGSIAGDTYGTSGVTIAAANGNVEIGDLQKEVFKLNLVQQNSLEAVKVERVVLYVEGTIEEAKDVTNWKLYSPAGDVLATADKPVDRYVTFVLATPYVVDKGLTKNLSVKADITNGSSHYFRVFVQNNYDIVARGATTGAALMAKNSAGTSLTGSDTQFATGGFKMKAGSLTISKAASSPSGNVAPSAQNVVLGTFDLRANGEKLEIRKLGVYVFATGTAGTLLTGTLSVKDAAMSETYLSLSADTSGLQGVAAGTAVLVQASQRNLSSYITIESGATKTLQITGTISANATSSSNYTVNIGYAYAKRWSTNDYTDLAPSAYTANTLSLSDVSLTVAANAGFSSTTRARGGTNLKIAEFVLLSSSADDIRISSIGVSVASSSYLQNMKMMMDGAQLGTTIGSPNASGNTFTTNVTIAKSTTKILSVYADVRSDALTGDTFRVSLTSSQVNGYGVASGKSLSNTPLLDLAGQLMTVMSGTLTISRDGDAVQPKIILAGQTGVELNKIKLEAFNESLTLRKITLSMGSASADAVASGISAASSTQWTTTSSIPANINLVYLYDGATSLNPGGTSLSNGEAIINIINMVGNDNKYVAIAQDTPKVLTVKADITGSGVLTPLSVGNIKIKSTSTSDMEVYSSQGLMSDGLTLLASAPTDATSTRNAASAYFLFHDAAPVASVGGAISTVYSDTAEIARLTVTNPGTRTLTLATTTILITLVNASTTGGISGGLSIYEESTQIDTDATTLYGALAGGSTTSTSISFTMASNNQISAGASKTYVVKANTNAMRTGRGAQDSAVILNVRIAGSKGYLATDYDTGTAGNAGPEYFWQQGKIAYSYTPVNGAAKSNNLASDSGTDGSVTLSNVSF